MELTAIVCSKRARIPRVTLKKGRCNRDEYSHAVYMDLSKHVSRYEDECRLMSLTLLDVVLDEETPEWYNGTAFKFLRDTVEGQEFLEFVLSEVLQIRAKLSVRGTGEFIDNLNREKRSFSNDTWKVDTPDEPEIPEIDVQAELFNMIDGTADEYVYTIEVFDSDTLREFFYVGKTKNPLQRLKNHVSVGGDFAEAKSRSGDTHVVDIHSLVPASEVSEQKRYEQVESSVNANVYGGV